MKNFNNNIQINKQNNKEINIAAYAYAINFNEQKEQYNGIPN